MTASNREPGAADKDQPTLKDSIKTPSVGEYVQGYFKRISAGDLGPLPIIVGLIIIAVIFQSLNSNYLTPRNFVNLIRQMADITTIAYGIVFVLLIGEIDLSVSYVSAIAGAITVVGSVRGFPVPGIAEPVMLAWWQAIIFGLIVTTFIGLIQGSIFTFLGVPSFIVTLAGFLVWSGALLLILDTGGTIRVPSESPIREITNFFLPATWGWILAATVSLVYAVVLGLGYRYRKQQNLATKPLPIIAMQILGVAALISLVVYISNQDRGVPLIGVLLLLILAVLSFVANQTQFGRYVYAVGGNEEAARRAGINVRLIQVVCFMVAGLLAGMGGIVQVSRLGSISTNAGGGDLLLNSIAAAVIGGTSLFGGRGTVSSALYGALVIASLASGMALLGWSAGRQFVVTGIVLILAVLLDSLSRRRQKSAGIA